MAAFDPRDRGEVGAARGNPGYSGDRNAGGWGGRDQTNSYDSRRFNSRYAQNPIATRPGSWSNIGTALGIGAGFGPMAAAGMLGGAMLGMDTYSGPVGSTTGFSYDGPNRAGAAGYGMSRMLGFDNNGKAANPIPGFNWPGMAPQASQPKPQLPPLTKRWTPAVTLGGPITGLDNYSVGVPSYSYFGSPRPKAAMLR